MPIIIKKHFVAFLDILGYGDKISEFTPEELKAFLEKVNEVIDVTKAALQSINGTSLNENFDVKFRMFSDNIFLYTETNWFNLLLAVSHLQVNFVLSDMFIRGALSYGDLYANGDYISGRGLLQSYELEDKIAIFPRVIVDTEFTEATKKFWNISTIASPKGLCVIRSEDFENIVHFFYDDDFDGWKYISYLDYWKYYGIRNENEEVLYSINDILSYHKEKVESNLENPDYNKRVLQKYSWSKKYHNKFCQKHHLSNELEIQ